MSEAHELDLVAARDAVTGGELSPAEIVDACLARIEQTEPHVHAWEHLDPEAARTAADVSGGPLRGVPCGIKDIFNTRDMPTEMGSPVWSGFTPGNDARVVHYARLAGSAILGKTVTAEFAVHTPGKTLNPHDARYSPGTSSSGSAVAVACGMVPWALGSQTAGSIVRPASYSGVYGFKPSYGTIARTGMLKTTDTLDQVGWFTRSARDLGPLLDVLRVSGRDYPLMQASLDRGDAAGLGGRQPRIGLVTEGLHTWAHATRESSAALAGFVQSLRSAGFQVEDATPPSILDTAHETHGDIYDRSIAYYFQRESHEGTLVSPVIHAMCERGRGISLERYAAALERQDGMRRAFAEWMQDFDVVLTLSSAGAAPPVGEPDVDDSALVWTLCGAPVVSVPQFTSETGLPFGAQFVGARFGDRVLLDVLELLEERELIPRVAPVDPSRSAERMPRFSESLA
jgi:Asp-tRNA(Asn)/Glu-tRNA(Gln) amidotransferase A subunit family amidase